MGEAVLDAFAWRVQRTLRPEDLVARIGPYSLGVLLDGSKTSGLAYRRRHLPESAQGILAELD